MIKHHAEGGHVHARVFVNGPDEWALAGSLVMTGAEWGSFLDALVDGMWVIQEE